MATISLKVSIVNLNLSITYKYHTTYDVIFPTQKPLIFLIPSASTLIATNLTLKP
jgi:hypothetical protein